MSVLRTMVVLALLASCAESSSEVMPDPPMSLFPLAKSSVTYDIESDSSQPSALPGSCPLLSESSNYEYGSFYYDGSPRSVANFSLSGSDGHYENVAFAFTLNPDDVQGVFFEYRSDDEALRDNDVTRVKGELIPNGDGDKATVRMTLSDEARDYDSLTSSHYELSVTSWKTVVLTINVKGKMQVIISDKVTEKDCAVLSLDGLAYPGTVRLGESWDGDSYFLGHINCLAFYDILLTKADVGQYQEQCKAFCPPETDSSSCSEEHDLQDVPQNCDVIDPDAYRNPRHLWPLSEQSLGYDVVTLTLTHTVQPADSSTCPDLHDDGKFYPARIFDGSVDNQVKVRISEEAYSFTVAMYIFIYTEDAVLLEYAADDRMQGDFTEFVIYLEKGFLRVELKDSSGVLFADVTSGDAYKTEEWRWMAFAWNYGQRQVRLVVDSKEVTQTATPKRRKLSTPGTLTVGGASSDHWPQSSQDPQPFVGRISCLALYDTSLDKDDKGKYEESCKTDSWTLSPSVRSCPVEKENQFFTPINLWPLTQKTVTCDVIGNVKGANSISGAPEFKRLSDIQTTDRVMSFGEGTFEVTLRVSSVDDDYYGITFGAFVEAGQYQDRARLMTYSMDDVTLANDVISHMTVDIVGELLEVKLTTRNGLLAAHLASEKDVLETGKTKVILISWDLGLGLQITVADTVFKSPPGTFLRFPVGAPGKLKLGGGSPNGGEEYRGQIGCVAFFSHSVAGKECRKEFEAKCLGVEVPNNLGKRICFEVVLCPEPSACEEDEITTTIPAETTTNGITTVIATDAQSTNEEETTTTMPAETTTNGITTVIATDEKSTADEETTTPITTKAEIIITSESAETSPAAESIADSTAAETSSIAQSTATSSTAETESNGESIATSTAAETSSNGQSTATSSTAETESNGQSTATSTAAETSSNGQSTATSSTAETESNGQSTATSTAAETESNGQSTATSTAAETESNGQSTATSSTAETESNGQSTATSTAAETSSNGQSTATSSTAETESNGQSTATSTAAETSSNGQSTATSTAAETESNGQSTATSTAAETESNGQSTATSTAAETESNGQSTATSSAAEISSNGKITATSTAAETSSNGKITATSSTAETESNGQSTATSTTAETSSNGQAPATSTAAETENNGKSTASSTAAETESKGQTGSTSTVVPIQATLSQGLKPTYLWPLNNVTRAVEVLSGMSSLSPHDVSSCFRVDDSEPSLARPHLKFDGSLMSSLVMAVNTSVFAGDFTVVLFVKAEQPVEGVLFDYTASDPDTTKLSSIQVAFNANRSLDVSLWSSSDEVTNGTLCSHLVVHGVFTNKTIWSKLIIQKISSARELQVSVDDLVWTTDYDCYDGSVHGSQGRLSIGGRDDGKDGAGFRGSLRCLMIFESVLDEVVMGSSQLETMCEHYGGAVSSDIPECETDADMKKQGFRLVKRDAHPAASAYPPIKSVETLSLVRCAEACMQAIHCKSFVITAGLMSRKECQFYDYVTKFNIVASSGSNYHEVKNGI